MSEWWQALTLTMQIYYGMGILGAVILVFQLLMLLIGGIGDDLDMDGGGIHAADGSPDIEHGSGLHILSSRTVIAFMTGFGWTGAFVLNQGGSYGASLLIAFAVGVALMFLVFQLMRMLFSLRDSGTLDYRNAIGRIGNVHVRIPAGRGGEGQIQIEVQGRLSTAQACTDDGEGILSGRQVRVLDLVPPRTLVVTSNLSGAESPPQESDAR